jgi:hypothetical protein
MMESANLWQRENATEFWRCHGTRDRRVLVTFRRCGDNNSARLTLRLHERITINNPEGEEPVTGEV